MVKVNVQIKTPWWANAYVSACFLFAKIFNVEPDTGKMAKLIVNNSKVTKCQSQS